MEEHKCKRCSKEFDNYDSLRRHNGRIHKIKSKDFYVEFYLGGDYPKCKCGCGEIVNWFNGEFKEYKRGHISRINNNWGHNQTAINNSAETRKEQFKNGERSIWNVGLTKESDIRLKKAGLKISKSYTDIRRLEYSKRMRENRLGGIVPTQYGKNHSQWNGGSSTINMLVRNNKRLYENWIYPILKRDNFKCTNCGSTDRLEVHHNDKTMASIISEFVDKTKEYTFEEKKTIVDGVIKYHTVKNVSGKVLCNQCHTELHPSYNYI